MPIYIILILIGIAVALVINFMPKKTNPSLEEEETIPEPTQSPIPTPRPLPKIDPPLIEAKSMKAKPKNKTTKKTISNKK
jgi:hypothetical protein